MDGAEFEQLLKKYHDGELTGQEQKLIGQWLDAKPPEKSLMMWTAEDKAQLLTEIHQQIEESKTKRRTIPLKRYLQAAAVFLAVIIASYYAWHNASTPAMQRAVSNGAIKKVLLADGSIVWLKHNSTLTYPPEFSGSERQVTLNGEALFEVAKDAAHPFIIQCGELTAKVLGTSFNIKIGKEKTEVTVLTGKVNVSSDQDRAGIDVLPNEKALYSSSSQKIDRVVAQQKEVAEVTVSTEYNMHFEETAVGEIIKRIEGKFNVNIETKQARLGTCTITADLTDQSLESTMKRIASLVSFEYTIQNSTVTIRGGNCP